MIKRELAKDPAMAHEDWSRFLPKFKKKNPPKKKKKVKEEKKEYTPFPPAQTPRKVDLMMESGEYFLSEEQKQLQEQKKKKQKQFEVAETKRKEKEAQYVPPKV